MLFLGQCLLVLGIRCLDPGVGRLLRGQGRMILVGVLVHEPLLDGVAIGQVRDAIELLVAILALGHGIGEVGTGPSLTRDKIEKTKPMEAITGAAILIDKARLVRGQATGINVNVLLDVAEAIRSRPAVSSRVVDAAAPEDTTTR